MSYTSKYSGSQIDAILDNTANLKIVQTAGDGESSVMSQKAVTDIYNRLFDSSDSSNCLDIATKTLGMCHTDGQVYTGGAYDAYYYFEQDIPVSEGDVLSFQYDYAGNRTWSLTEPNMDARIRITRLAAYDSSKNVLSTLGIVDNDDTNPKCSYTVPAGVSFVRITTIKVTLDRMSNVALVKNAVEIIPYVEYGGGINYNKFNPKYLPDHLIESGEVLAFLPDEIVCAVGRTIEIYNSQVCPLADKYHFRWDCRVGKALKRKFSVTGTTALIGDYTLTLELYDDDMKKVYAKSCTLKIVNDIISGSKSICTIGDSLTNGKPWLDEIRSLSGNSVSFVGTRGTTEGLKHEGRSGFTAKGYLSATDYDFEGEGVHPFWDSTNGKFSWSYYKTNSGVSPDAVQIFLGTNDFASGTAADVFSSNVKQMVDSIRESDGGIPIFVVLTICWGDQNGIGNQTSSDGFASQKGRFKYDLDRKTIGGVKALYEALKEYANVYFIPLTQCHDSEYNFGAVETPVNPRAAQNELIPTEAVHPQQQGYEQMADVMYSVYCSVF